MPVCVRKVTRHDDDVFDTEFRNSKGIIDLTSLSGLDGKPAYPDVSPAAGSNYIYSYNPCKPFSEGDVCSDVAVCQATKDKQFSFILGKQDSAKWNTGSNDDYPTVSYLYENKIASISLICTTDEETNELDALGEGPLNYYRFTLKNKCACWNGCRKTPPQQNCTIDGTTYTSDKQIIQSLPFRVTINPPGKQPSPPTSSYAIVDRNSRVSGLTLVNVPTLPSAIFCLDGLQELSILNSPTVTIPDEISRLSSSLTSLFLSNISRSTPFSSELFNLNHLSTLSIVNCGLEALSDDVSKLTSLTQLTLDQNLLTSLPWTVSRLPSLTSLSLQNNPRLSSVDTLVGSTSLNILRASNCTIDHLPANIPNLHTIEFDGNQLASLSSLETITARNCSLLSFKNNRIASMSSASLSKINSLNNFYLSNNALTTLPDTMYVIEDLKIVDIRNNDFSAKEAQWIQGMFRMTNTTVIM
ncbi:hypothetical protein I4U23_015197 [Adineta vaga]|nr:hypothetical protein I4U23_015197 [Adineta vaga]